MQLDLIIIFIKCHHELILRFLKPVSKIVFGMAWTVPLGKKVNLLHFLKEISKMFEDQNGGVLENVLEHWVRI